MKERPSLKQLALALSGFCESGNMYLLPALVDTGQVASGAETSQALTHPFTLLLCNSALTPAFD